MSCNIKNRENLITRYLNQELSDEEMLAFETHYFDCKTCYADLKLLEQGLRVIKAEGAAAFAGEAIPWYIRLKNSITNTLASELPGGGFRPNYGRLAFALVFFALLISTPLLYRDYQVGQTYADNFIPHGFLESHIAQSQRSDLLAMELTPGSDENFSGNIHFQWQPKDETALQWRSKEDSLAENMFFELLILNNKREENIPAATY